MEGQHTYHLNVIQKTQASARHCCSIWIEDFEKGRQGQCCLPKPRCVAIGVSQSIKSSGSKARSRCSCELSNWKPVLDASKCKVMCREEGNEYVDCVRCKSDKVGASSRATNTNTGESDSIQLDRMSKKSCEVRSSLACLLSRAVVIENRTHIAFRWDRQPKPPPQLDCEFSHSPPHLDRHDVISVAITQQPTFHGN
jgi:hypothetical protein